MASSGSSSPSSSYGQTSHIELGGSALEESAPFPVRALLLRLQQPGAQSFSSRAWREYLGTEHPAFITEERAEAELNGHSHYDHPLSGSVLAMSRDGRGCRAVQNAIQEAENDDALEALAGELRGHVREMIRCPHGNHVMQKLILALRPASLQFIVDEILQAGVFGIARHKYGCRIVERLVENCTARQIDPVVDALFTDFDVVSQSQYGHYVITHLLQNAEIHHRNRLREQIEKSVYALGVHAHGCAVLNVALNTGNSEERQRLAMKVSVHKEIVLQMAGTRHGHAAVKHMLPALPFEHRRDIEAVLAADTDLVTTRYGRLVVASIGGS